MERMEAKMDTIANEMNNRMDQLEQRINSKSPPTSPLVKPEDSAKKSAPLAHQAPPQSPQQQVVSHDKRWRAEDIGYFDGSANQVFAFVDRLQSVSSGPVGVKTV